MKAVILFAVFAFVTGNNKFTTFFSTVNIQMKFFSNHSILLKGAPSRINLPRLPTSVFLNDKYPLTPSDERIVGGTPVVPNSLPFQISLQRRNFNGFSQSCGGSILNENVILNAAHCVNGYYQAV